MSLVGELHAQHKARLSRLSPIPMVVFVADVPPMPPNEYLAFDTGWDSMWHYDLVSLRAKPPAVIPVKEIQRVVAEHYGVDVSDILSHRRTLQTVTPRHVAMFLTKKLTHRSLPEIGRLFGRRDHTTVLHAVRKIEALCETDSGMFHAVSKLRRRFI
jgi:hypothetical protein